MWIPIIQLHVAFALQMAGISYFVMPPPDFTGTFVPSVTFIVVNLACSSIAGFAIVHTDFLSPPVIKRAIANVYNFLTAATPRDAYLAEHVPIVVGPTLANALPSALPSAAVVEHLSRSRPSLVHVTLPTNTCGFHVLSVPNTSSFGSSVMVAETTRRSFISVVENFFAEHSILTVLGIIAGLILAFHLLKVFAWAFRVITRVAWRIFEFCFTFLCTIPALVWCMVRSGYSSSTLTGYLGHGVMRKFAPRPNARSPKEAPIETPTLAAAGPEGLSNTSNATVDLDQPEEPSANNAHPAPSAHSNSCSNCAERSKRITKLEEERDAAKDTVNKLMAALEKASAYIAENTELRSANNALEARLERIEATLSAMMEEKMGPSEPSK